MLIGQQQFGKAMIRKARFCTMEMKKPRRGNLREVNSHKPYNYETKQFMAYAVAAYSFNILNEGCRLRRSWY